MTDGFVKLYSSITSSSVWSESKEVRVLWITMLAEADADGIVSASVPGLARFANLSVEECEAAIDVLESPDRHSRTKDEEGRRIRPVDGGWLILNHRKYRDMRSPSQVAEAARKAAYRERMKQDNGTCPGSPTKSAEIQTEVDVEVEVEAKAEKPSPPTAREDVRVEIVLSALSIPEGDVRRGAWIAILTGMKQGLGSPGMKSVPWDTLLEAAQELGASGGDVTPHRFKAFVAKTMDRHARVIADNPQARNDGRRGKMLAASELIRRVRSAATEHNPYSGKAGFPVGWKSQFAATELRVIEAIGANRILSDTNEGTLVSQMAKALEEAA